MLTRKIDGSKVNIELREQLIGIWKECFGDSPEYINTFLDTFLPFITLTTASIQETPDSEQTVGAFYSIPLTTSSGKHCEYLYAAGILEKFRGHGLFYDIVKCIMQDYPNIEYCLYSRESLIDWYAHNSLPYIYKCKMAIYSLDKLCKPTGANHILSIQDFSINDFISLRQAYVSRYTNVYIQYPVCFFESLKTEKDYCNDIFDLIEIDKEPYYIIGQYLDNALMIEETNIPSESFSTYASIICTHYNVECLKIKIPLTDSISGSGVQTIYSGQGTINVPDLWAPFTMK